MILFYITCKNKKEAEFISEILLKKKLVACTNYFKINSMYHWKKRLVRDNEFVLIAKTTEKNTINIEKEVLKIHSYSVPCIIRLNTDANKAYLNWLNSEVKK